MAGSVWLGRCDRVQVMLNSPVTKGILSWVFFLFNTVETGDRKNDRQTEFEMTNWLA